MSLGNWRPPNGNDGDGVSLGEMNETCISVRSLWKVFGKNPEQVMTPDYANKSKAEIQEELGSIVALQDVSFDVSRGETFVVMGLSGSGKSTLFRILAGITRPTEGSATVMGLPVGVETRKRVSYLPEIDPFYSWMTATY